MNPSPSKFQTEPQNLKPLLEPPQFPPTVKTNPYAKPFPHKCFRCQQPGHKSNEYPQRKVTYLVEGYEENLIEEEELDDVYEGAEATVDDEGDLAYTFIVQKLL